MGTVGARLNGKSIIGSGRFENLGHPTVVLALQTRYPLNDVA